MARSDLTASRLKELFAYDCETGLFTFLGVRKKGRKLKSSGPNYRIIRVDGVTHSAHRLAWLYSFGEWPSGLIDHIDGNKLNNRILNLRVADAFINAQNIQKAHKNNKASGLLGVFANREKWIGRIISNGKRIHLGTFETPEKAHEAYINAKRQIHQGCTI